MISCLSDLIKNNNVIYISNNKLFKNKNIKNKMIFYYGKDKSDENGVLFLNGKRKDEINYISDSIMDSINIFIVEMRKLNVEPDFIILDKDFYDDLKMKMFYQKRSFGKKVIIIDGEAYTTDTYNGIPLFCLFDDYITIAQNRDIPLY